MYLVKQISNLSKKKGIYTAEGPWEKAQRQKALNTWATKNNIIHFDTKGNSYGNPEHINSYNKNKFDPDMQAKLLKTLIEDTVQQNSKTIVTEAKEIHKTQGQGAAIKYLNNNGFNPTDPDSFFKQSQKSLAKSLYQGIKNNATSFLKWGGKKFKVIPTAAAGVDYGVSNLLFGMDPIASTLSAAQWVTPANVSKQLLGTLLTYETMRTKYEEDMGPDAEPYHKAILSGKGMFPQFLEPHKELIEGGMSGIVKEELGEMKESLDPMAQLKKGQERKQWMEEKLQEKFPVLSKKVEEFQEEAEPYLYSGVKRKLGNLKYDLFNQDKERSYKQGGRVGYKEGGLIVNINSPKYVEEYSDGTKLLKINSFIKDTARQMVYIKLN